MRSGIQTLTIEKELTSNDLYEFSIWLNDERILHTTYRERLTPRVLPTKISVLRHYDVIKNKSLPVLYSASMFGPDLTTGMNCEKYRFSLWLSNEQAGYAEFPVEVADDSVAGPKGLSN